VLLSVTAAFLATYLLSESTPGLEWGSYVAIVVPIMCAVICEAWLYRLKTIAFVWTAAWGGYFGSFAGAVHRDWDIIRVAAGTRHYEYAVEMLMLAEYFLFAAAGALAAGLMIGFSLIALQLRGMWTGEPAAPSH
jgi:hypothetical protein